MGLLERQRIHKRKQEKKVRGQKPETELVWLGFGSAMLNSSDERRWMSVGLLVKSDGGRRAARSQTRAGERDWEPKLESERDGSVSGCIGVLQSRGGVLWGHKPPCHGNL